LLLTDVLMHSRRLRFSQAQLSAMLYWGKALGAAHLPTQSAFSAWAEASLRQTGDPCRRFVSLHGNVFYMNDVGHGLAQDFANPRKRPYMTFYPEVDNGVLDEVWNGAHWVKDAPDDCVAPMLDYDSRHWFINELVQCTDSKLFIPLRWLR
ncbi:hypothetical protein CALCODRAFT_410567, partial [Calocera cornea HHB12733]